MAHISGDFKLPKDSHEGCDSTVGKLTVLLETIGASFPFRDFFLFRLTPEEKVIETCEGGFSENLSGQIR
jgi:hypothetical protein